MNVLVMQYRGGERVVVNTTYIGARRILRCARANLFPIVEVATYNGLEIEL